MPRPHDPAFDDIFAGRTSARPAIDAGPRDPAFDDIFAGRQEEATATTATATMEPPATHPAARPTTPLLDEPRQWITGPTAPTDQPPEVWHVDRPARPWSPTADVRPMDESAAPNLTPEQHVDAGRAEKIRRLPLPIQARLAAEGDPEQTANLLRGAHVAELPPEQQETLKAQAPSDYLPAGGERPGLVEQGVVGAIGGFADTTGFRSLMNAMTDDQYPSMEAGLPLPNAPSEAWARGIGRGVGIGAAFLGPGGVARAAGLPMKAAEGAMGLNRITSGRTLEAIINPALGTSKLVTGGAKALGAGKTGQYVAGMTGFTAPGAALSTMGSEPGGEQRSVGGAAWDVAASPVTFPLDVMKLIPATAEFIDSDQGVEATQKFLHETEPAMVLLGLTAAHGVQGRITAVNALREALQKAERAREITDIGVRRIPGVVASTMRPTEVVERAGLPPFVPATLTEAPLPPAPSAAPAPVVPPPAPVVAPPPKPKPEVLPTTEVSPPPASVPSIPSGGVAEVPPAGREGVRLFHGTNAEFANADIAGGKNMFGVHLTTDKVAAADYGKNVKEYSLDPKAKVLDLSDGSDLWAFMRKNKVIDAEDATNVDLESYATGGRLFQYDLSSNTSFADAVAQTAKGLGYDVVKMSDDLGGKGGNVAFVAVNPSVLRPGGQGEAEVPPPAGQPEAAPSVPRAAEATPRPEPPDIHLDVKPPIDVKKPVTPEEAHPTLGLNKAEQDWIRNNEELQALEPHIKRSNIEVMTRAKAEGMADKALDIAREAIGENRTIEDVEHAGMVLKAIDLDNQYNESTKTISELEAKGNTAGAEFERERRKIISRQTDTLTEGARLGGRETGRGMAFRRVKLHRDTLDIATVAREARTGRGRPLTQQEQTTAETLVAERTKHATELKAMEDAAEKRQVEHERALAEVILRTEAKKGKITQRTAARKDKIYAERNEIKLKLAGLGARHRVSGIPDPEIVYHLGRLAVNYAKEGIATISDAVQKVLADYPDVSERDVLEGIRQQSEKEQKRARVRTEKKSADLKSQGELLSDIGRTADEALGGEGRKKPESVNKDAAKIAKLEEQVKQAEKGVFPAKRVPSAVKRASRPAAIKALQDKLTELRKAAYRNAADGRNLERALKTINELQDHFANLTRPEKKKRAEDSESLRGARQKIADLRKEMFVEDRIKDLDEQLRTGNFKDRPKKVERVLSPELERKQIELKRKDRQIRDFIEAGKPLTIGKVLAEAANLARTVKATADMSAVFRQGLVLSIRRLGAAGSAFGRAGKAFFNEHAAEQIDLMIRKNPRHYLREQAGLYLADPRSAKAGGGEEYFQSRLAEKIPGFGIAVKASERHMVSYMNMIRTAAFDQFLDAHPNATRGELKAWADFINVSSGRGNLGRLAGAANVLSAGFFAPKFAVSRVQTPYMLYKYWNEPRVRKEIAKDLAATVAFGGTVLGLAALAGATVGLDPRDSDFGKIVIGKTHIDLWAGFQQTARVVANIGIAATDRLGWTKGSKDIDPLEMVGRFTAFKLSPAITLPLALLTGKNAVGQPQGVTETLIRSAVPIFLESVYDAYKEGGVSDVAISAPLSFFGVGTNTYDAKKSKRPWRRTGRSGRN